MWKQFIPLLLVAAVIIGAGTYFQGRYTERWSTMDSEVLDRFAQRVITVPEQLGTWKSVDEQTISQREWEQTNCKAYVSRTYENQTSGEKVSFYLVTGTARHITIHTPDWCYVGAGFKQKGKTLTYPIAIGDDTAEFATAIFEKPESSLRIFWTYSDDGRWLGPANPNYAKAKFGGRPAMYKIYLIGDATEDPADSPCNQFAQDTFPLLEDVLFTTNQSETGSPDLEL